MKNTIHTSNEIEGGAPGPRRVARATKAGPGFLRRLSGRAGAGCGIAVGAAILLLSGCTTPVPPAAPEVVSEPRTSPVVLREGDVVKCFFPGAAEFSNVQKIRTDGKLSMPMIGEIQAAGKTVSRLQAELSHRYKSELQNTEVVVSLESGGLPVIISGGVGAPGKFLFDRPTTLLEAIMSAGGFTDYARKRKVSLIRMENGRYQTIIYDMSRGLKGGPTPVVYVRGGDVIHVPLSTW
jgi:polysaccharide export outer membrane protein